MSQLVLPKFSLLTGAGMGRTASTLPRDVAEKLTSIYNLVLQGKLDNARYWLEKLPPRLTTHAMVRAVGGAYSWRAGHFEMAENLLQQSLAEDPDCVLTVVELSAVMYQRGKLDDVMALLRGFDERVPGDLDVLRAIVGVLYATDRVADGTEYVERLAARTDVPTEALHVRADLMLCRRRYDESIRLFREALDRHPPTTTGVSGSTMALMFSGSDPLEVRRVSEKYLGEIYAGVTRLHPRPPRDSGVLRVGYLSGDLCMHVVSRFFLGVLREHDRAKVHLSCYSTCKREDEISNVIKGIVPVWRNVSAQDDESIARVIQGDGIDVLVDLGGLTETGRPGVLARKPAPVQCTYLGYPATTGLKEVDYRISDEWADPSGVTDEFCTEKLWRLPRCAWAFELASGEVPVRDEPPALSKGVLTFGSFNVLTKVNQASTALWARVLSRTKGKARLLLTDRRGLLRDPEAMQRLRWEFRDGGADDEQIVLAPWKKDAYEHRARLREVDVMLDPLGYNGTTTTCEAMYYGVPTLTLPGESHVSRVGGSLMSAVGLADQFVAKDADDFVERAVALANDPTPLVEIRSTLRDRQLKGPLGDFRGLARALEDSYVKMVREHLAAAGGGGGAS